MRGWNLLDLQKKASMLIRACCIPKIVKTPELGRSREHTALTAGQHVPAAAAASPGSSVGAGGQTWGPPSLATELWAMLVGTESTPPAVPLPQRRNRMRTRASPSLHSAPFASRNGPLVTG